jgi:hypothetical protein
MHGTNIKLNFLYFYLLVSRNMSTAVRQVTAVFSLTGRAKHFPFCSAGTAVKVTAIRHATHCSLTEKFIVSD